MNILYVVSRAIEINTSASIRNHATIMGLIQNGHQVTLVSSMPDKKHSAYDDSLSIKEIDKQYYRLPGMQAMRCMGRNLKLLEKIKPYIYHLIFDKDIYDNLKSFVQYTDKIDISKYDLVISSSDPKSSHLFVDKLFNNNKKNIPWIQIWGDPFAADITRTNKLVKKTLKEENRLLSHADKVIYVSKLTLEMQKQKFSINKRKMFYLPIPYYKEKRSEKIFPSDFNNMKICYCGDYSSRIRDIRPLYDAVDELGLNMTICGMSDLNLKSKNRINILPRKSAEEVEQLESEADVLVHLSNVTGTQVPGKIYQYAATNKVILFILDGDEKQIQSVFEGYNRFLFVKNDKDCIKDVFKNIEELKRKVTNEPIIEFSATHITKRLLEGMAN